MAKSIRSKSRRKNASILRKELHTPVENKRMHMLKKYASIKDKLPKLSAPHLIDSPFRSILLDDTKDVEKFKQVWASEVIEADVVEQEFMDVDTNVSTVSTGIVFGAKEKRQAKKLRRIQKSKNRKNKS